MPDAIATGWVPVLTLLIKTVSFAVELTDAEAWHLAQFLKRVGFSDFRSNAQDEAEAYAMRDAADRVRVALAEVGYAPR